MRINIVIDCDETLDEYDPLDRDPCHSMMIEEHLSPNFSNNPYEYNSNIVNDLGLSTLIKQCSGTIPDCNLLSRQNSLNYTRSQGDFLDSQSRNEIFLETPRENFSSFQQISDFNESCDQVIQNFNSFGISNEFIMSDERTPEISSNEINC